MLPGRESLASFRVLDLSQDWDTDTPGFARYDGPTIKWVKRVAFEGVGGMEITSTLHVGTHLDAPNHFITNARGIGELSAPPRSAGGSRRSGPATTSRSCTTTCSRTRSSTSRTPAGRSTRSWISG